MKRLAKAANEFSKLGGKKRFAQIGSEGMAEMSRKGHLKRKQTDPEFYVRLAQAGLAARMKKKNSPVTKLTRVLSGK